MQALALAKTKLTMASFSRAQEFEAFGADQERLVRRRAREIDQRQPDLLAARPPPPRGERLRQLVVRVGAETDRRVEDAMVREQVRVQGEQALQARAADLVSADMDMEHSEPP